MSREHYRPEIQGLRAIAVLAVMAFHLDPAWLPGGFIGVDVFLVISGYLITSTLLKKKGKADYTLSTALRYFYASRFKRIAPAYFTMLVLVTLAAAVFFLPKDFDVFKEGLEKAAWFNSNHYFSDFGDYFAPASHEQPLLHTWSLAVEVQFYLIIPFIVLMLPAKALKWSFGTLLIGFTLLAEYRLRILGIEQASYYSLYARLPEFFAGGLSALYVNAVSGREVVGTRWPALFGLGLILLAATTQPALGAFPGLAALLPVVGSVLLLTQPAKGFISRLLCSRALVWVGALSYSLYLWHWSVLAFLRYYSGSEVLNVTMSLVFVMLTVCLSIVSYYGVEKALRDKQTARTKVMGWGGVLAAALGTSQVMTKINALFTPEQQPIEYRRYADHETICHGKIVGGCLQGNLSSGREILVLGDSHAAMLNHFFDYIGRELDFKARVITASSCVTIPRFDYWRIAEWAHQPCLDQIQAAQPYIEQAQTIFIAGVWNSHTRSDSFNTALRDFLQTHSEKEIIILSQVPRFNQDVSRIQRFSGLGLPISIERDPSYRSGNDRLAEMAEEYSGVEFMRLDTLPVFDNAPFYQDRLIYSDAHHVNEIGALMYGESAVGSFVLALESDN